jgi:hypothetical protein
MATNGCKTSPDNFCYICGTFLFKKQQRNIADFVKKAYLAYFGLGIGHQDKSWAPQKVWSTCVEELRRWFKGKKHSFSFGMPMLWMEPRNHFNEMLLLLLYRNSILQYRNPLG